MIQSLINLSCTRFVNIHPDLHITQESQNSSIPGRNSADPSNNMPPPSTKNRSRNIYGCMVDVYKLTPEKQQQHSIMLLNNYHELCNTNNHSSMFVSLPPITNIESLSQSTVSSLGSVLFGRNRAIINIQQQNTLEVANTYTVITDNEEPYHLQPQDILNVFAAAELSSCSSSNSAKYKRAWLKTKVICSFILSAGECPATCS